MLKLNDMSALQEKQQTSNVLSTKSHEYPLLWRTTNPFIPLMGFSFILQCLVRKKFNFQRKNAMFRHAKLE